MNIRALSLLSIFVTACAVDATSDASPDGDDALTTEASMDASIDQADSTHGIDVVPVETSLDADHTGAACVVNSDCRDSRLRCSYRISDGCAAMGTCLPTWPADAASGPDCGTITPMTACGCSGAELNWASGCIHDYDDGYAPAPVLHMGTCGG